MLSSSSSTSPSSLLELVSSYDLLVVDRGVLQFRITFSRASSVTSSLSALYTDFGASDFRGKRFRISWKACCLVNTSFRSFALFNQFCSRKTPLLNFPKRRSNPSFVRWTKWVSSSSSMSFSYGFVTKPKSSLNSRKNVVLDFYYFLLVLFHDFILNFTLRECISRPDSSWSVRAWSLLLRFPYWPWSLAIPLS